MSQIVIYDVLGKEQEKIDFSISRKDDSPKTYSCAVRVLLQNWRQGTVGCKGRSDIAFSNKKPWKQKGTGRARAGSARSPIWRKGGVVFGPQPRIRKLSINKKQIALVLNNVYHSLGNNIHCLDFAIERPSTKKAFRALRGMGLADKKIILFLPFDDEKSFASFRNISNLRVVTFNQPNVFDLANCSSWLFLKKDLDLFKDMVSSWN